MIINKMLFLEEENIYNQIINILEKIKNDVEYKAAYIRGSILDQQNYIPWDIDIVIITSKKLDVNLSYHNEVFYKKHHIPIDFCFVDFFSLERAVEYSLLKIMLKENSKLIMGTCILNQLNQVYPNHDEIQDLKIKMLSKIESKLEDLSRKIQNDSNLNFYLKVRSFSKYILRFHCLDALKSKKLFRNPTECLSWIFENLDYPIYESCSKIYSVLNIDIDEVNIDKALLIIFYRNHIQNFLFQSI